MEAFALSPDAPRVPLPQRLLSDERLLRLVAAGNAQAFGAVYARYHAPLYAYCRSIVRDPDDARDALQNTMLKALAALGRGEERELSLKPWLFRIAHNESISLLRKRRPSEPLTDAMMPPVAGVHAEMESRQRLTQLVEDLQELPERQRGALIMREVNGLSYEDIAGALAISEGAARQTVFEARTALVEYGQGREVACENIRRSISDGDGRALRARRVRAHLRACNNCREFQSTLQIRRRDLALLAPALSGGSIVAVLQGVLGMGAAGTVAGSATSAGVGGAGLLGGGASALMGSGAAKSVVAIVAATAAGAGAVKLGDEAHQRAKTKAESSAVTADAASPSSGPTARAASAGAAAALAAPPATGTPEPIRALSVLAPVATGRPGSKHGSNAPGLNRDHGRGRPDDAGRGDHGDGARGNGPGPREDAGAREGDYQGSTGWADSADEDRPAADGKDDGAGDLTGDGTRRRGDRRKDPAPAGQGDYAGGPVKPAYDGGAGTRPPRPAGETKPALASAPAPEADPVAPVEDTAPPPLESSAAEPADSPEPTAEPVAPAA